MFRSFFNSLGFVALIAAATPAFSIDINADSSNACSLTPDFIFPAITITSFADVVVGAKDEFHVEKQDGVVLITHIGQATVVKFPSIVAIGSKVELIIKNPGTQYCVVSAVAVVGGSIKINSNHEQIGVISSVGNVSF